MGITPEVREERLGVCEMKVGKNAFSAVNYGSVSLAGRSAELAGRDVAKFWIWVCKWEVQRRHINLPGTIHIWHPQNSLSLVDLQCIQFVRTRGKGGKIGTILRTSYVYCSLGGTRPCEKACLGTKYWGTRPAWIKIMQILSFRAE